MIKKNNSSFKLQNIFYCTLHRTRLQLGFSVDGNEGVLVSVTDLEVSAAVTSHVDLLPSASVSLLLAGNDVTVGSTGQAGVQGHIQIPWGRRQGQFFLDFKNL